MVGVAVPCILLAYQLTHGFIFRLSSPGTDVRVPEMTDSMFAFRWCVKLFLFYKSDEIKFSVDMTVII